MQERRRISLSTAGKIAVLSMIIGLFLILMIPIYQMGENHQIRVRIATAEENIRSLEEKERTLKSELGYARSPEALIDNVVEYNLDYRQIDSSATTLVARGNV